MAKDVSGGLPEVQGGGRCSLRGEHRIISTTSLLLGLDYLLGEGHWGGLLAWTCLLNPLPPMARTSDWYLLWPFIPLNFLVPLEIL